MFAEINERKLSLPEARAVARPFFTRGPMSDADAVEFVTKLKERRNLTPADQQVIALSVMQSELISDEEVKRAEQWIERENPSLEKIESRAEEMRNKRVTELQPISTGWGTQAVTRKFSSRAAISADPQSATAPKLLKLARCPRSLAATMAALP